MTETLVIGGTGVMGARVVRRLLDSPDNTVAILTRNARSPRATALLAHGSDRIRMVEGTLDDPDSVRAAVAGTTQVFCNTDFFATESVLGEHRHGITALEEAKAAGVDRFLWSSLDGAVTLTGGATPVPHFDAKAAVAAHIAMHRSEEMMRQETEGWYTEHVSILTTSPYYENLRDRLPPHPGPLPDGRSGLVFSLPLGAGRYPMVGLDDIAWFADHMFGHWQSWGGRDLAVTGDSLTGVEIAATLERVTGIPCGYRPMPLDVLQDSIPRVGHDYAAMFRFFQERDVLTLDRSMELLRRIHPRLLTFEEWIRSTGWDGSVRA